MPGEASLRLITLSALMDDAESIESIRNHGEVAPYGLALVSESDVADALTALLLDGLIEAFLPDRLGRPTNRVTAPTDDEASLRQ